MLLIPWCLLSRYIASVYLDIMSPMFLFTQQAVYVVRLTSRIALKMFLMQAGSVCRTCTWRANFEITRLELCMKEPKPAGHFSMTIGPLPPHSVSTGTEVALCPWIAKVLWRTLDLWHPSTIFRHDSWPSPTTWKPCFYYLYQVMIILPWMVLETAYHAVSGERFFRQDWVLYNMFIHVLLLKDL